MADYNSSLPIRTEANGDAAVKIVDGTTVSQALAVDASGRASVKAFGTDPGATVRALRTSEQGSASVDGFYDVANNSDPSNVGLIAHTRAASPADSDQIKKLTAITNSTVHALDISLHDEDGAAYSDANPLPIYVASDPGTEVQDYDTQSALAAAASDNHDYAVPTGSFKLRKVIASGSGKMKIEVQWSPDNVSFTTLGVMFNSTANPNMEFDLGDVPYVLTGAANAKIRVIRTNRDNQSQDVYSTIVGVLI